MGFTFSKNVLSCQETELKLFLYLLKLNDFWLINGAAMEIDYRSDRSQKEWAISRSIEQFFSNLLFLLLHANYYRNVYYRQ